jgi:hypothetical protein
VGRSARGVGTRAGAVVLGLRGQPERSPERDRDLLQRVHGLLHATLHAGLDHRVPDGLVAVLAQLGERGAPTGLGEVVVTTPTPSARPRRSRC